MGLALAAADLTAVEAALDGAAGAIARLPSSGAKERLQTLASILRRVLLTWQLTPPSPRQLTFVWHQVADLVLDAKMLADRSMVDDDPRFAVWLLHKAR
ncbi:MAG: hypothetical protein ACRENE_30965 [Polyangiaceae bacterium]